MSSRTRSAVLGVAAVLVLSRLLGFVREMVIADKFGTSAQYDLYLVAVILPALAYGVINFASYYLFVPYISRLTANHENDDQATWRALWPGLNLTLLVGVGITTAIIIAAPLAMRIWAGDYPAEQFGMIIFYSRLTAAIVLLGTGEAFMRAYLNVKKQYAYPAGGFIVFNLVSIGSIVLLHDQLSVGAIVVGLVFGLALQNVYLLVRILGYSPFAGFTSRLMPEDRAAFFGAAGTVLAVEIINRSYFMIDRYFAPQFGEGVIAALNYSQVLVQLPESIIGFAIGAVVFPMLSKSASTEDREAFANTYRKAVVSSLIIAVPLTLTVALYSDTVVWAVFERGVFDQESTLLTSDVLSRFCYSIVFLFVIGISARACYAAGRGYEVLWIVAVGLLFKFGGTYFAENGAEIAAATAMTHFLIAGGMVTAVARKIGANLGRRLMADVLRIGAAGLVALLTTFVVMPFYDPMHGKGPWANSELGLKVAAGHFSLILIAIFVVLAIIGPRDILFGMIGWKRKAKPENGDA